MNILRSRWSRTDSGFAASLTVTLRTWSAIRKTLGLWEEKEWERETRYSL